MSNNKDEFSYEQEIALKGGALVRCREHHDVLLNAGSPQSMRHAYALGTNLMNNSGEAPGYHREDLMAAIKAAVDEAPVECPICYAAGQWR